MSTASKSLKLPPYEDFDSVLSSSHLSYSPAMLHGLMTGFLCVGRAAEAETYLRALLQKNQQGMTRSVMLGVFSVLAVTQQQLNQFEFEFELMLPEDSVSIQMRAKAFSEWCQGFLQGLELSQVSFEDIDEEDVLDALQHFNDFAALDHDSLNEGEDDERSLMEVVEYSRVAVIRIRDEFLQTAGEPSSDHVKH